ncbi:Inner membrane protein YgaZ [Anoxybacillus sp. P3H1B]|uniref:AzlC family ABC transporter permease n=1 Tax=Anoxybacillaceae TaxID=3120669 RepID=UPI000794EA2D|nr:MULTISPECIES: AzlC family ABC transporter permease [Anoxybacillus]KXG09491.1 Inner membrane protein YgaZ [Anoxybacillus sp. P3H1B]
MSDKKKSWSDGIAEALPLAIAIGAYGLSYGVLAVQAHFSWISAVAMSMFVFSGSVQLITVAMLTSGASVGSVFVTATLLNLRNLLYGAALAEGIAPAKKWRWLLSFGVSDEPFVLGSSRFKKYGPDPLYFAVVAGIFYFVWVVSSLVGSLMSNQADPQKWGLDLAFPVTFAALLIPGIREKPAVATALAAVFIALGLEAWQPGNEWTIIVTGMVAPFAGLYWSRGAQQHA